MATVEFDPQPLQAYSNLEKAGAETLLDAIDDAIDALETDPGNAVVRRRSFGDGLWGMPVRDRSEDWLIIWERDATAEDLIVVQVPRCRPIRLTAAEAP